MNDKKKQLDDEAIDALLNAHFSQFRIAVTPSDDAVVGYIEHAHDMRPSPYVHAFFISPIAMRFAFSFASLLIVVGVAAGALETELYSGNITDLPSHIPIVREALATQIDEMVTQREHTIDDEDFAAPESGPDAAIHAYDVYGEVGS
jgi:hypothetical protein